MTRFILQKELEAGYIDAEFSHDRRQAIAWLIHLGQPICLTKPQYYSGIVVPCALPVKFSHIPPEEKTEPEQANYERLHIVPIVCRAMTIGKLRSGLLAKVIIEMDGEQWMFSSREQVRSSFRFDGPGCDPNVAEHSRIALADLIRSDHDHPAMMRLYGWLKEKLQGKETTPSML